MYERSSSAARSLRRRDGGNEGPTKACKLASSWRCDRAMKTPRSRLRGQRGAVAVEFALILPVLVLLVTGAIEFGRVYSQLQVYQGGARESARCAAVQASGLTGCTIYGGLASHVAPYDVPLSVTVTLSGGGSTTATAAIPNPASCTNDTRGQSVTVSWPQTFQLNIPFWANASITRTIVGVFRCE